MKSRSILRQKISRRAFLATSLSALALAPGSASALSFTTHSLELTSYSIPLPQDCEDLDGFKICFVSDLHVGPALDLDLLENTFRLIEAQKPDLLLLGGDFLWIPDSFISSVLRVTRNREFSGFSEKQQRKLIFSLLQSYLNQLHIPQKIFSVFGNHDRWSAPDETIQYLHNQKSKVLSNTTESFHVGAVTVKIFGVDDYWTGIPQNPSFKKERENKTFRLVLSHNPDFIYELYRHKQLFCELALCGHTHGGQIQLPLIGSPFYNIRFTDLASGKNLLQQTSVITTRGIGVVEIPYRINCPPEVVSITLTAS